MSVMYGMYVVVASAQPNDVLQHIVRPDHTQAVWSSDHG